VWRESDLSIDCAERKVREEVEILALNLSREGLFLLLDYQYSRLLALSNGGSYSLLYMLMQLVRVNATLVIYHLLVFILYYIAASIRPVSSCWVYI
jgi:hypothetical protein